MSKVEITTVPKDLYYHEYAYVRGIEADVIRLRVALTRIAEYGERHLGYVNAMIDGHSLSKFARTEADKPVTEWKG